MPDHLTLIQSKAFRIIPGIDYNRISYELREEGEGSFILYEIVIKEGDRWEYLRDHVYPRLVRYLKEKGLDPSSGEGVIVSIFFKENVYFLRGSDFFKIFCEMEGLNLSAFHFRTLRWLSDLPLQ